ncbi:unnamed protein product [Cladocopium goreaui]|uniref:N-acetyltransferase domain-containing protein n=1 Tax=Cladocopium goreaui TaxID=2562237 RepID=A0A9P1DQJ4_9DINO|nr:unnamed protein product [Cladocopium goreaui]
MDVAAQCRLGGFLNSSPKRLDVLKNRGTGTGDEAIELLVAAFNDEPSASQRDFFRGYVRWLAALAVHVILAVRGLSLAVREDGEDGEDQMLGVALLIPPETRLEDVGLAELTKTSGVGLPPFHRSFRSKKVQVSWGRAARRRERALSTITRDTHRQLANMPHWYLWFLAVKPHVQGRGVGTLLLDEIQKLQDRDVFPCYLETSRLQNVAIYTKKKFRVEKEFCVVAKESREDEIQGFDVDLKMYAMLRPPMTTRAKL